MCRELSCSGSSGWHANGLAAVGARGGSLRERDHVRRVRGARVLGDIDLRVGQAVDRRAVPVAPVPHRQHAGVVRVAQAGDACHEEAQQHDLAAVGQHLAEASIVHILGVAGEVRAGPPQGCCTVAAHQRLEARNRVVHDVVHGAGAMERPLRVQARPELEPLILDAPGQRPVVRLRVAVLLHAVLDPLDLVDRQVRPHAGVHVVVGPRHRRLRPEAHLDHAVLLGAGVHCEEHVLVHALLLLGLPQLPQVARVVPEPRLRREPLLSDESVPRQHQANLGISATHRRVEQTRQAVVHEEGGHVVSIALAGVPPAQQAAVPGVVEQHTVRAAGPHQVLDVLPLVLVVLVIGAVAQHHSLALRQRHQGGVPVDDHRRPLPLPRQPQLGNVRAALGGGHDQVRVELLDGLGDGRQEGVYGKLRVLRVRQRGDDADLEAGVPDYLELRGIQLHAETGADDQHALLRPIVRARRRSLGRWTGR
mmetsp:Transcript_68850/g.193118  ORF Transcript_68850/g.193118 Transcript_68850/m.193118 type:complete len:478 (-) Transcript_68850:174-1607(-)